MEGKRMTVLEQRACESLIKMAHRDEPDYWEKLRHQYAGMAMQAYITRHDDDRFYIDDLAKDAVNFATALVEKLKEEK